MKQKLIIEIEAGWGSDFQCKWAFSCLVAALQAWRIAVIGAHKQNKIIATLNGNPIQDIPTDAGTETKTI